MTLRHPERAGRLASAALAARKRLACHGEDEGFTLIEMMVSLAIVVIVMTAGTMLYITNIQVTSYLRDKQAAVQLADDAIEQTRGFSAIALYAGRDQTSSQAQWSAVPPDSSVKPLLDASDDVWGTAAANTGQTCSVTPAAGVTPCIPTVPVSSVVGSRTYKVSTYIGGCIRAADPDGDAPCTAGDPTSADGITNIGFLRVIVAVTWADHVCPAGQCTYATAELRNATNSDPVFNLNNGSNVNVANNSVLALKPPGDQSTTIGVPVSLGMLYSGGTGTVTFSSSTLPTGLHIDSKSGLIYGTPPSSCSSPCTISVTATDGLAATSTTTFTWTVNPQPSIDKMTEVINGGTSTPYAVPGFTTSSPLQNQTYTLTPHVTGGSTPMTWSLSGSAPAGLSFNTSTGVISGKPTTVGTTSLTLTVTDRSSQQDSISFTLKVLPPPPTITTTATSGSATVGSPIPTFTNTVSNGATPLVWTSSSLPSGLTIDSTSGAITGTPTSAGTTVSVITVTDSQGRTDTHSITWTISPKPSITQLTEVINGTSATTPSSSFTESDPLRTKSYTLTPAVSGGTSALTWSLSGTLPTGLTFSTSTGAISGTPTVLGSKSVTLTVTDRYGATDALTFAIKVVSPPAPTITTSATTASGTVGTAISSFTNNASNGDPALTWSASSLPNGLSISSGTGTITGTPTKPGTFSTVIKVTDSQGRFDTHTVTWTIATVIQNLPANGGTSYCMDVNGGTIAEGQKVIFWQCSGSYNQTWYVALDGTVQVRDSAGSTTKCLKYTGISAPQVVISSCNSTRAEQWTVSTSGGNLLIRNASVSPSSNACLGVPNGSAQGTGLDVGSCTVGARRNTWKYGP